MDVTKLMEAIAQYRSALDQYDARKTHDKIVRIKQELIDTDAWLTAVVSAATATLAMYAWITKVETY